MGAAPRPTAGYDPGRMHAISEKSQKTSECIYTLYIFEHLQKQKELIYSLTLSIHHYELELNIVKLSSQIVNNSLLIS